MRSFLRLVYALWAALALTVSQAMPVLHGLEHSHHHSEALHGESANGDSHKSSGAEIDDVVDHELLHCSTTGTVSTNKTELPVSLPVAVRVADVSTEPSEPPQDVTRSLPKLYVTAPPDQPRAPPVG